MVKYSKSEIELNNFSDLIDSLDLFQLMVNNLETTKKSSIESELDLIPKRGSSFPVRIILSELVKNEKYLVLIHDLSIEKKNEQILKDFHNLIIKDTYLTLFRQGNSGPEVYLTDDLIFSKTEKKLIETKVGVYFSTAVGQGKNSNSGLFGPLPFPDNPDYEAIIYATFLKDNLNLDPRAHGKSYCLFVLSFPKKLEQYYSNRHYLANLFDKFTIEFNELQNIKKANLDKLKILLID
jgi:hypothetical protein